jgi:AcrR family transcriptional regulator
MNMRTPIGDLTSAARIREAALRLFAERGPDAVTVRQVAAAAGVSPALVIRSYGSKDGLRDAVDGHVAAIFEAMLAQLARVADGPFSPAALPTLADSVSRHLPEGSAVPGYIGRMLMAGGPAAAALFRRLHQASLGALAAMAESGQASAGADPPVRAAFLLANDLAVLMLRDRLADVLGTDPLSGAGLRRWGAEVTAVYQGGLAATPGQPAR